MSKLGKMLGFKTQQMGKKILMRNPAIAGAVNKAFERGKVQLVAAVQQREASAQAATIAAGQMREREQVQNRINQGMIRARRRRVRGGLFGDSSAAIGGQTQGIGQRLGG